MLLAPFPPNPKRAGALAEAETVEAMPGVLPKEAPKPVKGGIEETADAAVVEESDAFEAEAGRPNPLNGEEAEKVFSKLSGFSPL